MLRSMLQKSFFKVFIAASVFTMWLDLWKIKWQDAFGILQNVSDTILSLRESLSLYLHQQP